MGKLLIAGGKDDPNLKQLMKVAQEMDIEFISLVSEIDKSPSFSWQLKDNRLYIDQQSVDISAAFVRQNVFHSASSEAHSKAAAWYGSVVGYLMVNEKINILNRLHLGKYTNKLYVLFLAKSIGLNIPKTLITNVVHDISKKMPNKLIAKPVMGGGYCESWEDLSENIDSITANPAIVQKLVRGDDIRIYRIDSQFIGFRITSDHVDYRKTGNRQITIVENLTKSILKRLKKLMDRLGLNWGAADFKEDSKSKKLYFLEVNSNPMFSVFDKISNGQITTEILNTLTTNKSFTNIKN